MRSALRDTLFSEPGGWKQALVQYGSAVLFVGLFVYGTTRGATGNDWVLAIAAANVLSGTAEVLPTDQRMAAGALRVSAVLLCLGVIVALLVAPDLLFS